MPNIEIDVKFHLQRYGAWLWQYARLKNNEDVISNNEVTSTVASKLEGPRIARELASDTSKFSRPRPRKSNLK